MSELPEPHSSSLALGQEYVRRVQAGATRFGVDETPRVVVIDGRRGTGKTTVLSQLSTRQGPDSIVLPTIRPEFFSGSDTVLGHVISAIIRRLREEYPAVLEAKFDEESQIYSALNRLLRKASVFGQRAQDRSNVREDAGVEAFARSAAIGNSFIDEWTAICTALKVALEVAGAPSQITVSVDDPDLAPENLPRILLDLRVLGMAANFVTIVCVNTEEVRRALAERYLALHPSLYADARRMSYAEFGSFEETIESQLVKALPPQYTVRLSGLTLSQRLYFCPLEEPPGSPTLLDLLKNAALPDAPFGVRTLGAFFFPDHLQKPTPISSILPANPRALRALYYNVRQLQEHSGPGQMFRLSDELVLGVLEHPETAAADRAFRDEYRIVPSGLEQPTRVEIDWRKISLGVYLDASDFHPANESDGQAEAAIDIRLSPLGSVRGFYTESEKSRPQSLTDRATFACLLLRDLSENYEMFSESASGMAPRIGQYSTGNLNIGDYSKFADGRFLVAPLWDGVLDYLLLFEAWNRFIVFVRSMDFEPERRVVVQTAVLLWWSCVTSIQRAGIVDFDDSLSTVESIYAVSGREQAIMMANWAEKIRTEVAEVYRRELGSGSARQDDYVRWVEVQMTNVFHPLVLEGDFIDSAISWRNELLDSTGRRAIAEVSLAAAAKVRLTRSAGEFWIEPFIDQIRELLPSSIVDELRSEHERVRAKLYPRPLQRAKADVRFDAAKARLTELADEAKDGSR